MSYRGVNRVGIDISKGHRCVPRKTKKGHDWKPMKLKKGQVGTTVYCEGYEVARGGYSKTWIPKGSTPYVGHDHFCRKRCGGGSNRWGAHENATSYRGDGHGSVSVNGIPISRKGDPILCPSPTTGQDSVATGSTKVFAG